jgi:hypothetical protein
MLFPKYLEAGGKAHRLSGLKPFGGTVRIRAAVCPSGSLRNMSMERTKTALH